MWSRSSCWLLVQLLQLPASLEGLRQLYLAGTFPINGSDGWQGGQVGAAAIRE